MSKNIIMQQKTASGYEELYPKTDVGQITGIEEYGWKVGDIRSTARNDLGEKWLLCNGDAVDDINNLNYSEVKNFLPILWGKYPISFSKNPFNIQSMSYCNGQWIMGGYIYEQKYIPYIWVADDTLKNWIGYQLDEEATMNVVKVIYNSTKGEWLVLATTVQNGNGTIKYYTASNLNEKWIVHTIKDYSRTDVIYHNGKYIICAKKVKLNYYSDIVAFLIDEEDYATQTIIVSGGQSNVNVNFVVTYINGKYIIGRLKQLRSGQSYVPCIYTTEDLMGTWATTQIDQSSTNGYPVRKIIYQEGTYVIAAGKVYASSSLNGIWNICGNVVDNCIDYYNGLWVKCEENNLIQSATTAALITGEWVNWEFSTSSATETYRFQDLTCKDGTWVVRNTRDENNLLVALPTLPMITVDNASAYIKVKS